jgi:two-component system sensor histidine kinase DegS
MPADLAGAEAAADDERLAMLRAELAARMDEVALHQAELARLELAVRTIERTWLFIERGDQSLVADASEPALVADMHLRIVEAQEAERTRLAQEVHDGPAQSLSNAIFQVDYVDRVLDEDAVLAHKELRFLSELLRRELGDVRTFISLLRPPVPDPLGLDDSIREVVANVASLMGSEIEADLEAPGDRIPEAARTVVLRVVQESLQNVRKHAEANRVWVVTRLEDDAWALEVRDDGRGFDVDAVAARGRRNFGLQFMRERAGLIGAHFEVRSRAGGGTVVRLAIPIAKENHA